MEHLTFYTLHTGLLVFVIQKLFQIEKRLTKIESNVKISNRNTGRDCENE